MINGLLLSKENLPMSWPLSSLDSPKSPLHTLPFLKLRISINHLLSLWMASSHTSQRKKKTPRYKQSFKALAWAAFFLPSCVNDGGGGCALEVEPMIPSLPSSRSLLSRFICPWSSLLISSYHQRPLSFQKQMERTANFKGDASDLYPVMMSIYFCLPSWSLNLLRT